MYLAVVLLLNFACVTLLYCCFFVERNETPLKAERRTLHLHIVVQPALEGEIPQGGILLTKAFLSLRSKFSLNMSVQKAYNSWASQYDTNENKTRDLEAVALRQTLSNYSFDHCLEIGCGTGKNTEWLITKARQITAVDLSEAMLAKAREKISNENVFFKQADINAVWDFTKEKFDLVTFSLVLEHIENLDHIFCEAAKLLNKGGHIYAGELHPFKQYSGSKARFETEEGLQVVQCYNHNVSDFTNAALKSGFAISELQEFFDNGDRTSIPRLLVIVFEKK